MRCLGLTAVLLLAWPLAALGDTAASTAFEVADRVIVHKTARRLELVKNGRVLKTYPIALGLSPKGHKEREGDFRTPEGEYALSYRNPKSDYFLSIKVSYPSAADRQRARELGVDPGGQIMIHGQPNVPKYSPEYYSTRDWTDGCIAVSNAAMVEIWLMTMENTPIEIRP